MREARFYERLVSERLSQTRCVVVSGPRQVGKSAALKGLPALRLDADRLADRLAILEGPAAVIEHLGLTRHRERELTVVIENLQGHRQWQSFVRRLSRRFGKDLHLVVSVLDPPRDPTRALHAGFGHVRIHPWSVGERARIGAAESPVSSPVNISDDDWDALLEHGGFPEPFARREQLFSARWRARWLKESIDSDLLKLAAAREPAALQTLALRLAARSATRLIYSELSRELHVTVDTVRRWVSLLEALQLGFRVSPWFTRVPKALRKEPKWFLRDWSAVTEPRARARTLVACHLLKAVHGWTDLRLGRFELRYVRDKARREVDFLVLRDGRPWFLVDVAREAEGHYLEHFQVCTRAEHAFLVAMDAPYSPADCFTRPEPTLVPARTLLSQLL